MKAAIFIHSFIHSFTFFLSYSLQNQTPVVLEGCSFHKPALKWTLEFLRENLQDQDHTMFISPNHKFLYFNEELLEGKFENWRPPTERIHGYFKDFEKIVDQLREANNGTHAYFQV